MSLKSKINEGLKTAMKAKDQATLRTLRAIKTSIMKAETAAGRETPELSEAEEMKLIVKEAKQRRESIEQFETNGRADLAVGEKEELAVIEGFLPQQMSEDDIRAEVEAIVAETGASSMKDMGRVMGMASKKMAGKADGKVISGIVRQLLS